MLLQVFVLFWTHSAKRSPTGGALSGEEEMADPGASTLLPLSQSQKHQNGSWGKCPKALAESIYELDPPESSCCEVATKKNLFKQQSHVKAQSLRLFPIWFSLFNTS